MRELVAALYVLGGGLTATGVWLAYRRAVREKARLDDLSGRLVELAGPSPDDMAVAEFNAALDETKAEALAALQDARRVADDNLEKALRELGINDPLQTFVESRLPVTYWARRSALADTLVEFRTDGLVALLGLALSTGASVWSLYV